MDLTIIFIIFSVIGGAGLAVFIFICCTKRLREDSLLRRLEIQTQQIDALEAESAAQQTNIHNLNQKFSHEREIFNDIQSKFEKKSPGTKAVTDMKTALLPHNNGSDTISKSTSKSFFERVDSTIQPANLSGNRDVIGKKIASDNNKISDLENINIDNFESLVTLGHATGQLLEDQKHFENTQLSQKNASFSRNSS